MTSTTKISFLLVSTLSLAGCYSQGGWTPTVDAYGDPNAQFINRDMGDCQQLATHASGGTAKETAIGAGVGGLIGGATGMIGDPDGKNEERDLKSLKEIKIK